MRCSVFVLILFVFDTGTCKHNNLKHSNVQSNTSIKYYTKQNNITIPIMIHLDKALTTVLSRTIHHTKLREKFKLLAKDILKDAEKLFARQSLHQKIKFQLLDVKIVRNGTKKVRMTDNVSEYLKSYCRWQGEKKIAKKKWFFSVMFTGLDVYYLNHRGDQVRSNIGRGYSKGLCSNKHSCTMLEWHPEDIAFMLTHEIAHSLGISHDGLPYNECRGQHYIMDATYKPKNPAKHWSACNKRELDKFLKSTRAWCLRQDTITIYDIDS